jgi:hypothetical protein
MIRASKRNAGALYIDGHNNGERLCLAPGQEAQIEVIDIHSIYLLGDTEEAWYDWIAR